MMFKVTLLAVASAILVAGAIDKRITNGEVATLGEIPYIVWLDGPAACGGALLDSTTVLTAAHCARLRPRFVRAGSIYNHQEGVVAEVASFKVHPDWALNPHLRGKENERTDYAINDIAVIKLASPIERSDNIGYIDLPPDGSDPEDNSTALVAGWGRTSRARHLIPDGNLLLRKVHLRVQPREICATLDPDVAGRDTVVCAGGDSGQNICKNDSGGPLVDQETGQVIGIASFVILDAEGYYCRNSPSVFTRVGSYLPFIKENLGGPGSVSAPVAEPAGEAGSERGTEGIEANANADSNAKTNESDIEKNTRLLKERCDSSGNPRACQKAGRRCAGRFARDAEVEDFLQCVDTLLSLDNSAA